MGELDSVERGIISFFDRLEHIMIVLATRIGPWAAPVAPAYLVARSVAWHFNIPYSVAWTIGITLEMLGLAAMYVTIEMSDYNSDPARVKSDPFAPVGRGKTMIAIYFITGLLLTVILEVIPKSVIYAPAALFVLAFVTYQVISLISSHARRVQEVARAREERKRTHKDNPDIDRTHVRRWSDKHAFLSDTDRPPDLTVMDIVAEAGISDRTARRWLSAVKQNGRNG